MGSYFSSEPPVSKTQEPQNNSLKHNLKILLKNNAKNDFDSLKSLEISDFKYPLNMKGGSKNMESKRYLKYDIQNIIKKYENNIYGGSLTNHSESFINDSEYNSDSITTDGNTIEQLKKVILAELSEIQTKKTNQSGGKIKKKIKKIVFSPDPTESSSESSELSSDTDDSNDDSENDDSSSESEDSSSSENEDSEEEINTEEDSLYSSSSQTMSNSNNGDTLSIFPFNSSEIYSSSDHHLNIVRRKI